MPDSFLNAAKQNVLLSGRKSCSAKVLLHCSPKLRQSVSAPDQATSSNPPPQPEYDDVEMEYLFSFGNDM